MRKLVALMAGALALTGCGGTDQWEGDVKFKVAEADSGGYEIVLAGEMPRGALRKWQTGRVGKEHFPDGVQVGDEVTCHVTQRETGDKGFGTDVQVTNCRKA
jgi:hypothetical protein